MPPLLSLQIHQKVNVANSQRNDNNFLICGIHLHYAYMLCTHVGVPFQVHLSGVHSCLQWRVSIRLAIK